MRVRAIRRIVTPVKGAVIEPGDLGTLGTAGVRWDSLAFTNPVPGLVEGADYEIVAEGAATDVPATGRTRVRARVPIGLTHRGGIVQPGTLGWRTVEGVAFDSMPWEFLHHLTPGKQYECVPADTQPPTGNGGAAASRFRERELLSLAEPIKESINRCCEIAADGGDFTRVWEHAQRQIGDWLSELHRFQKLGAAPQVANVPPATS
jgi:hypothetical protein